MNKFNKTAFCINAKGEQREYIDLLSKDPKQWEFLFDRSANYRILEIHGNSIVTEVIT